MMKWRTFARVTGDKVELDHDHGDSRLQSVMYTVHEYSKLSDAAWEECCRVLSTDNWFPIEIEE